MTTPEVMGVGALLAGVACVVIALFLPWLSFLGQSASFWELSRFIDIATTGLGAAVVGCAIATFLWPRDRPLRIVLLLVSLYFVPFLPHSVDWMLIFKQAPAGPIVAVVGGALVIAGVAILLWTDHAGRPVAPPVTNEAAYLTSHGAAVAVGALVTLILLLPASRAGGETQSSWEIDKVGDIVAQLLALGLAGVALAAIFQRRLRVLQVLTLALAGYFGLGSIVGAIEGLAAKDHLAATYLELLAGALAVVAAILVAVHEYPRPPGPLRPAGAGRGPAPGPGRRPR